MSEMIERVARAICGEEYGDSDAGWENQIPAAKAAIAAMKLANPQEGVPGGIAFEDTFFGEGETVFHAMRNAWNATIDAALDGTLKSFPEEPTEPAPQTRE